MSTKRNRTVLIFSANVHLDVSIYLGSTYVSVVRTEMAYSTSKVSVHDILSIILA